MKSDTPSEIVATGRAWFRGEARRNCVDEKIVKSFRPSYAESAKRRREALEQLPYIPLGQPVRTCKSITTLATDSSEGANLDATIVPHVQNYQNLLVKQHLASGIMLTSSFDL